MKTNTQSVALTIMGKEYRIVCEAQEEENLIQAARQLDMQMCKMRDSGKVNGPERIAVMAALNLAHELRAAKEENAALAQNLEECLASLSNKIENVLENPQTS